MHEALLQVSDCAHACMARSAGPFEHCDFVRGSLVQMSWFPLYHGTLVVLGQVATLVSASKSYHINEVSVTSVELDVICIYHFDSRYDRQDFNAGVD
jgi:hypothetical protein